MPGQYLRTDLAQCLDALEQRGICKGPVGALGISYGAVLALQWAAVDPRVQSVIAISPYLDPGTAMEDTQGVCPGFDIKRTMLQPGSLRASSPRNGRIDHGVGGAWVEATGFVCAGRS